MTSRRVLSDSIAVTSGRGTMTSRTIVSPNSKIEWISSFSSRSIEPSSWPTSAIERRSASDTNGPCFRPRPGRSTFARPMSALVGVASRRPRPQTSGATASAARSEYSTPNVLLIASTSTKYRSVNPTETSVIPRLPYARSARIATRTAEPF